MLMPIRLALVLTAAGLLTACGGSDAECAIDTDCAVFQRCEVHSCVPLGGEDRDTGPGGGTDSGTPPRDAGPATDAGGMDAGPMEMGTGTIFASQLRSGGTIVSYAASASFTPAAGSAGCATTEGGGCATTVCTTAIAAVDGGMVDAGMADAGPPPVAPHAGAIQITGGLLVITLTPDPMTGLYAAATGTTALWSGAETLTVAGVGNTVPAFSEAVTPPVSVTLTAPALPAPGTPLAIDRTTDLAIGWTALGGAPGSLIFLLSRTEATAEMVTTANLACTFPLADGAGAVPTAQLSLIPAGSGGSFSIYGGDTATAEPAGWTLTVAAGEPVADGAGVLGQGSADFL